MRKMILATAAVLSLAAGSSYAASNDQNGYAVTGQSTISAATTTASPLLVPGAEPNPWQGTQSWQQWNSAHPPIAGGN